MENNKLVPEVAGTADAAPSGSLKSGALGLPEVIMQAVGHISPAAGTLTALAFITTLAGVATPVTFFLGGAVCLLIAVSLAQLAR